MLPVVYAYHAPVMEIDQREAYRQIEFWKKSWSNHGWDPKVLNLSHASLHPKFRDWTAKLMRRPTSNPRAYEIACFHRWMAVAALGGGWMSDYDVLNLGVKPQTDEFVGGYAGKCPCLIHGPREFYEKVLDFFVDQGKDEIERGVPHYSDQVGWGQACEQGFVRSSNSVTNFTRLSLEPGEVLIHIKTDHANNFGMIKSAIMAKLLER